MLQTGRSLVRYRTRVWTTLHTAWIPERLKSLWYTVIHDIVPTNERLAAIHLSDTELCNQCGKTDTLQHRITDCCEGATIWNWTRTRIAALPRINPRYIPDDWTIPPISNFGPPKAWGNSMDHSSPGGIQNAKEETFDTHRLYRFSAPSQMESLPKITQTTQSWKLS